MKWLGFSAADGFQNDRFRTLPEESVVTEDSVNTDGRATSVRAILTSINNAKEQLAGQTGQ